MGNIAELPIRPTPNVVFVQEAPVEIKKNQFEYVGGQKKDYIVTAVGMGVTVCHPGDYVLFDNYHEYEFRGQKIIKVDDSDIHGVCHA